jgi:hypothetical protein
MQRDYTIAAFNLSGKIPEDRAALTKCVIGTKRYLVQLP